MSATPSHAPRSMDSLVEEDEVTGNESVEDSSDVADQNSHISTQNKIHSPISKIQTMHALPDPSPSKLDHLDFNFNPIIPNHPTSTLYVDNSTYLILYYPLSSPNELAFVMICRRMRQSQRKKSASTGKMPRADWDNDGGFRDTTLVSAYMDYIKFGLGAPMGPDGKCKNLQNSGWTAVGNKTLNQIGDDGKGYTDQQLQNRWNKKYLLGGQEGEKSGMESYTGDEGDAFIFSKEAITEMLVRLDFPSELKKLVDVDNTRSYKPRHFDDMNDLPKGTTWECYDSHSR
ncbi:hypothetical protein SARC_04266 [Sphaeroforma arctica JP610]|uniref:Uncharacterized protein n=1 Tax=Sphaeroforma arctica JP610 TaxID=667725 RepID=A0A0L0G331_9EUKA|nr:hypothetical protein SARC_04266 [Sphaeroforma arctica JP610]KNC83485.1 hypothetical protein SARC_04266 [Sphaeroforma arctica JP610]|eukprot:XP_014157387.1 hypothetical protein SARC_04266 [Sphaeroforma arctica JP610]